ncbi:response regulator transcription factor [Lacticigenium naphthae]|uniref:response regulator transcription factor n=1 Tax=Lacticigenium naphthae TaxID=515351 RepID=UPI00041B0A91|nr:response regulator transcription factor [Lacticigenium naphthae]
MEILMIEDNESVCEMIEMFFLKEEWQVVFSHDGKKGLDIYFADPEKWDLVILDLMLPTLDGINVCKEIRKSKSTVPIIMLTARDTESDQVIGLEIGADDYVTKPFSPLTLVAKIKALMRRTNQFYKQSEENKELSDDIVQTTFLTMSVKTHETTLYDKALDNLTPKEFDLLYTMAKSPKQVFSREQLLQIVWNYEYFGDERTVDAHIKKLRQKIDTIGPQVIQTVWGVGYKFDDSGVER